VQEEEPQQGDDDPTATRALFAELDERGTTSELENLALNIQGLGKRRQDGGEKQSGRARSQQQHGFETAEVTDDFCEELLNEGMKGGAEAETRRLWGLGGGGSVR
jgi:heat shock transcription factor, other eukaryote